MSSKISIQDVRHVAKLSRLEMSEEKLESMTNALDTIIESVSRIAELDLSDVQPTTHALEIVNVFGEDEPHESLTTEQALKNAPSSENNCFKVPSMGA